MKCMTKHKATKVSKASHSSFGGSEYVEPESYSVPMEGSSSGSTKASASSGKSGGSDLSATADNIVEKLQGVDSKINALSAQRLKDQETMGDKIFKAAFPSLIGMVGGKIFSSVWDIVMNKIHPSPEDDQKDHQQGLIMSVLFAAASAAVGTLLTAAANKGSQAIVHKLQRKRIKNNL